MHIDLTWTGYGVGLVLAFWFFGLVVSVVFAILRRIGYLAVLVVSSVGLSLVSGPGVCEASSFIALPPGIDWDAVFGDLMLLVYPFVIFFVAFGAFNIIKRGINMIGGKR